jgi:3-hydroxybutyryl-CoA dehydrogenase
LKIDSAGVVGCGLMGSGIAEVVARAGMEVTVREPSAELLEAGRSRVEASMARAVAKEKMTRAERDAARSRLRFTTRLADLATCGIVIEAIVEEAGAKNALFAELDALCGPETIFASNTSSLPIADMAVTTGRPDRFLGLHFFNPVPVMKLVEVVRALGTSDDTVTAATGFVKALGKVPIAARDSSGFIVNLLLVPFLLDAIRQLERGVASVADVDAGMTLGCGHPMGPLMLADFVGLDTLSRISEIMYEEYREERYARPPLLRRLTASGRLGRKSGQGFYDWAGPEPTALPIR